MGVLRCKPWSDFFKHLSGGCTPRLFKHQPKIGVEFFWVEIGRWAQQIDRRVGFVALRSVGIDPAFSDDTIDFFQECFFCARPGQISSLEVGAAKASVLVARKRHPQIIVVSPITSHDTEDAFAFRGPMGELFGHIKCHGSARTQRV